MSIPAQVGRALDLARALLLRAGRLRRVERGSRAECLAEQRARLTRILEHAASRSPYYRDRWHGRVPSVDAFRDLEPTSKTDLLGSGFDAALTDRSVTKESLRKLVGSPARGPYVVLATSGTTGEPAIMPYSRSEWVEGMAYMLRGQRRHSPGVAGLLKAGRRVAAIATQNPIHASTQLSRSFQLSGKSRLSIAASASLEEQVARVQAYDPATLMGYPSGIDALARAQLDGRLRVRPRVVLTGGETVTRAMREHVRSAWGIEVFDCYGLTETLVIAWECAAHRGLHVDEDAVVIEVVDDAGRVLPYGERGSAVFITNLYNRTLPIIRYRVGDVMVLTDEPCACGLPFARIVSIEGRRDEVLKLRGAAGGVVEVGAMHLETPLEALSCVERFQIRPEEGGAEVRVVLRAGAACGLEDVMREVGSAVAAMGASKDSVRIEAVQALDGERGATDKRRRVIR